MRLHIGLWLIFSLLVFSLGCESKEKGGDASVGEQKQSGAESSIQWRVVGAESGLKFTYENGEKAGFFAACEVVGGGVGAIDFDRDGLEDLMFAGGGRFTPEKRFEGAQTVLMRNVTARRASSEWKFEDVSVASRVNFSPWYSHGVAVGDYDNDGWSDVVITGFGGIQLWRNQGDGTFQDATEVSGVSDMLWGTSAAWGDFDGDGNLDLYVAHYDDWSFTNDPECRATTGEREPCGPGTFKGLPDSLWMSQGDGVFVDRSERIKVEVPGKGLACAAVDLDRDGDLDIYVANDADPNWQFQNRGDGTFDEVSVSTGTAYGSSSFPDGSMGIAVGDFDNSGSLDLWVTNFQRQYFELYQNQGNAFFTPATRRYGLAAMGNDKVGWGNVMVDMDHDGDLDFMAVNGHVERYPTGSTFRQKPMLLENVNGSKLLPRTDAGDFLLQEHVARALVMIDIEQDGDVDLAVTKLTEPAVVLKNESLFQGKSLTVELIGTRGNRDAIGVTCELRTKSGKLVRQVIGGGTFGSTHSRKLHFGIKSGDELLELEVQWPGGVKQVVPIEAVLIADRVGFISLVEP